jgi:hypothetical protein
MRPTVSYVAKGERYAQNHTATEDLVVAHRAGDSLMKISNLYGYNDANPPQRVDHPGGLLFLSKSVRFIIHGI